jgi:hypothetical protein
MLNEGIITNSSKSLIKSEMLKQLWAQKQTTPDAWERAVFSSLTGHAREDVDWEFEDNKAGYYTWVRAFNELIDELTEDGYVRVEEHPDGTRTLVATAADPGLELSQMAYPSR